MGDGGRTNWPLDPIDRLSEIMFGLLMALTFTGTISVALGEGATVRDILLAAIGCNIAWGIVDAVVYLMTTTTERARGKTRLAALKRAPDASAMSMVRSLLPEDSGKSLTEEEARTLLGWLRRQPAPSGARHLTRDDLFAAAFIFLLVCGATWPPILPFLLTDQVPLAMRLSNAIAVAMLFCIGLMFDRERGEGSTAMRLVIPIVGVILVVVTIALGG
jgi:hypothetical protein